MATTSDTPEPEPPDDARVAEPSPTGVATGELAVAPPGGVGQAPATTTKVNGSGSVHREEGPDGVGPEAELEAERVRLLAEIAAANERILAARTRTAAREAEARDALRAEIETARRTVAEMEEQHRKALAVIRHSARLEVERILAEARRLVDGGDEETAEPAAGDGR